MSDNKPLWDDNEIITWYKSAFDEEIDIFHLSLMRMIRDDMQARIAELEQRLLDAQSQAIDK